MQLEDARLICRDCAQPFTFSTEERQEFASQGLLHPPSRCADCRSERKARQEQVGGVRPAPGFRERRDQVAVMSTTTICGACGKATVVPFVPSADRVAYCPTCYAQRRAAGSDDRRRR